MTCIYSLDQIKAVVRDLPLTSIISEGFKAYSKGDVIVPPVGELNFDNPPGDTHIKYGYIKNHETYVIKIASGFYKNPEIGLPSSTGMMLVFYQKTGMLKAILLDEGYLTDIRTAVAGSISATCLTGKPVKGIGIIGTGTQARFQLMYLKAVTSCRQVYILENPAKVKVKNADICVADLTGVAVQDIQIATAVCDALSSKIKEKA